MLTPISNKGPAKVDPQPVAASLPARVEPRNNQKAEASETPAARFAKLGPPIDVSRVNEIRSAIANGRYTLDADRLAEAMLALDLPVRDA
jgi:flagellar biosynthesis anti-sigma factor FlgM